MRLGMSNRFAKTFPLSIILSTFDLFSTRFSKFNNRYQDKLKPLVSAQFTLEKGEVFRVPSTCQEVHVLSGIAWLTVAGKDIILTEGETVSFDTNQGIAILSALGDMPLFWEVI